MPEKRIPCKDCEAEKKNIEAGGVYRVTECAQIPSEDEWCIIRYEMKE